VAKECSDKHGKRQSLALMGAICCKPDVDSVTSPSSAKVKTTPAPSALTVDIPDSMVKPPRSRPGNVPCVDLGARQKARGAPTAASPLPATPGDTAVLTTIERKKRMNVAAESFVPWSPLGSVVVHKLPPLSEQLILKALAEHFMFSELEPESRIKVMTKMELVEAEVGRRVTQQGDPGDHFYIVERGNLDVFVDSLKVGHLGPGDVFGDLALILDAPRAATVVATTPCKCWGLNRATFRQALLEITVNSKETINDFLERVPLLQGLDFLERRVLSDQVAPITFEPGKKIIRQGHTGNVFYIVQQGFVHVTQRRGVPEVESHLVTMHPGDYFGEGSLVCPDQPRAATVTAGEDGVVCLALNRLDFALHLGPLVSLLVRNFFTRVLLGIPLLQKVSERHLAQIAEVMEQMDCGSGDVIFQQGDSADNFYIILDGSVEVIEEKAGGKRRLAQLSISMFFGEMALLSNRPRNATVVCTSRCKLGVLTKQQFSRLPHAVHETLVRVAAEREAANDPSSPAPPRRPSSVKAPPITSADLVPINILGEGSFGVVKLVQNQKDGKYYALKQIKKRRIVQKKMIKYVNQERHIMTLVDHPFVIKLHAYFADSAHLCMLLDLVSGGELHTRMQAVTKFSAMDARSYFGMTVLALEHLHAQNIIYRDLKPENLMISENGYIKLIDFGLSALMVNRTFTICGTPEYMAPEIVLGRGYSRGVDLWAAGVFLYEMLVGFTPFNPENKLAQIAICRHIAKVDYSFEGTATTKDQRDLVKSLLVFDPKARLGMGTKGFEALRGHRFFHGLDWSALAAQTLPAPWVPPAMDYTQKKELVEFEPPFTGDQKLFKDWD